MAHASDILHATTPAGMVNWLPAGTAAFQIRPWNMHFHTLRVRLLRNADVIQCRILYFIIGPHRDINEFVQLQFMLRKICNTCNCILVLANCLYCVLDQSLLSLLYYKSILWWIPESDITTQLYLPSKLHTLCKKRQMEIFTITCRY